MSNGNQKTVYVVYNDRRKDFSKAEHFGQLRDVFSSVGKHYNGAALIDHARHVLRHMHEGDYLLMVGDPTLCVIASIAASEVQDNLNLLRWNREEFKYEPLELRLGYTE